MRRHTHNPGRAGYSLLEILIAAGLLSSVLGLLLLVGRANDAAFHSGITSAQLDAQLESAMSRIVTELRVAGTSTLSPQLGPGAVTSALEYRQADDYSAGMVQWSGLRRLAFELAPGETDDGTDENGNGLVDEGRLVLTVDSGLATQHSVVLTNWIPKLLQGELPNGADDNHNGLVDEPGFCIQHVSDASGDALLVRLTLAHPDDRGHILEKTMEVRVRVRN